MFPSKSHVHAPPEPTDVIHVPIAFHAIVGMTHKKLITEEMWQVMLSYVAITVFALCQQYLLLCLEPSQVFG